MYRALLVMTLALLLAAGGDLARSIFVVDGVTTAHAAHDCCPPCDGPPDADESGCCDLGCSCTCAAGIVAVSPAHPPVVRPCIDPRPLRVSMRVPQLLDHDTGPPPTPPPIG